MTTIWPRANAIRSHTRSSEFGQQFPLAMELQKAEQIRKTVAKQGYMLSA